MDSVSNTTVLPKAKKRNKGERGEVLASFILLVRTEMLFHNNLVRTVVRLKFCENEYFCENNNLVILKSNTQTTKPMEEFKTILNEAILEHNSTKETDKFKQLKEYLLLATDKSSLKRDVEILFSDSTQWEGYSIKSFGGANPTLLNASKQTSFEFKVPLKSLPIDFPLVDAQEKIQDKINKLKELNSYHDQEIICSKVVSPTFHHNLELITNNYSTLLGIKLYNAYAQGERDFKRIFTDTKEIENVKELLWMSCLGMVPRYLYNLENGNNQGMILFDGTYNYFLKDNQELKNFLFDNAKFDTPSTTRNHMVSGWKVNEEHINFYITLQIRICYPQKLFTK